jgi:hypothetical protein
LCPEQKAFPGPASGEAVRGLQVYKKNFAKAIEMAQRAQVLAEFNEIKAESQYILGNDRC